MRWGSASQALPICPTPWPSPTESWAHFWPGWTVWVVDALRRKPHPTHAHLALTLEWIARARPARAVLTNMHMSTSTMPTLEAELPAHIRPAHDGMVIELPGACRRCWTSSCRSFW
jgi:phosphoribosyl 1,2-cyclic phosphate phosphodiesterase